MGVFREANRVFLHGLSQTRWSARVESVRPFVKHLPLIILAINDCQAFNLTAECKTESRSILNYMKFFECCMLATIWLKVLVTIDQKNKVLQARSTTLDIEVKNIKDLIGELKDLRREWTNLYHEAKLVAENMTNTTDCEIDFKERRIKKRKTFHDETRDEALASSSKCVDQISTEDEERFRVNVFYKLIDNVIGGLTLRFTFAQTVNGLFRCLWTYLDSEESEIKEDCAVLCKKYSEDLNIELFEEIIHLKAIHRTNLGEVNLNPLELLKGLRRMKLDVLFPNVTTAIRLFCSIPVTVSEGERSFSLLKRIKNLNRTTMDQVRLNHLGVIAMEPDLARSISYDDILEDFASKSARRVLFQRTVPCKKLALLILSKVTKHVVIQHDVTNLGIIPLLVSLLTDQARDLQKLAAAVISNVAKLKKSSKLVRMCGGIPILVNLIDIDEEYLRKPVESLTVDGRELVDVAEKAACALCSLSQSNPNKKDMHKAGITGLLPKLLKARKIEIVVQTMGILQNCGNLASFQMGIQTMDLVEDIVRLFKKDNTILKMLCALAIFRHSENERIRTLVRKYEGLAPLVQLIKQENTLKDKELLIAATGAIWKLSYSVENVEIFDKLNTIPTLVDLVSYDDETVLVNVVGALAECAKLPHNAAAIHRAGGLKPLVELLNLTNQELLANTAHVLGECAWDLQCMEKMEQHDAVRLIWSLLKKPSTAVQAHAAWALVPCIKNATESGDMVRSFVGGIELIVKLLKSPDSRVVGCICAALAMVATDQENLAILTDLGVVPILAKLVTTPHDNQFLQEHLASAIANCCNWDKNCFEFGRLGAVPPLVNFLYDSSDSVQATTIDALSQLSSDPFNCITLHQSGVVPLLIKAIGSSDHKKQVAAAKCLRNIRKLALTADKIRTKQELT